LVGDPWAGSPIAPEDYFRTFIFLHFGVMAATLAVIGTRLAWRAFMLPWPFSFHRNSSWDSGANCARHHEVGKGPLRSDSERASTSPAISPKCQIGLFTQF
jgi:hypothetical protein